MKKHLLVLIILSVVGLKSYSQTLFGNEWIFDYTKTFYKIKVVSNGLYRIPYSTLQSYGLASSQGKDFVLFNNDVEVPLFVTSANALSSTDFIEFYGQKNDGTVDAALFRNPQYEQFNPYRSFYTDTAIYFLAVQSGTTHQRMIATANSITSQPAEPYFMHTSLFENYSGYTGGVNYNLGGGHVVNPSSFDAGEGWFGLLFNSSIAQTMYTPYPYTAAGTPGFSAEIITSSPYSGNNNIGVNINNQYTFGGAYSSSSYGFLPTSNSVVNYFDVAVNKFSATNIPMNAMLNGQTPVNFIINSGGGYQCVSTIKLIYPKLCDFDNQNQEYFQINNSATNYTNKHLAVTNFNAQNSDAILYDFDQNARLVDVNNGGAQTTFNFLLPQSSSATTNVFLTNDNNVQVVSNMQPRKFKNFGSSSYQGNFIIVTNSIFRNDGTGHDYVNDYAAYRKSIIGGNYDTLIADINLLADEFAYGVSGHPLSIRNFAHYIDNFFSKPKPYHFFLIGKGQEYNNTRNNATRAALNTVPTFGTPGSDNLLTAYNNDWYPHIAIGRLSAFTAADVKTYLDKVKEYELGHTENCSSSDATLAGKDWQKQIIHLTGGADQYQQDLFDGYLNTGYGDPLTPMKAIIEDTLFGGHVTSFKKTSAAPIQLSASYSLDSLINAGVSIINFFGHSSFSTLEFAVDNPSSYQNFGKYPLFISNGCFSGNLFDDPALNNNQRGLSERFVVPDAGDPQNIGAIAYISTSDLGISTGLNYYTNHLYQNIGQTHYGNTLGECIRIGVDTMLRNATYASIDMVATGEQMLLDGDPAIKLNPHSKPDYDIEQSMVSLNPSTINFESGNTFHVLFSVENLGLNKKDSINIMVLRYFPKADLTVGTTPTLITTMRIKAPAYKQNFDVIVNLNPDKALGTNRIQIIVDANNEVSEICENNNQTTIDFNISSLDILPVYPAQFSIVAATDTTKFTLKASTVDPLAANRKYFIQFDTTEKFNSSQFQSTTINQIGGVISWKPSTHWVNNRVYYWRTAVDTLYGNHQLTWHNSSFTYIYNSSPGWDQSHYFEFKKDVFLTLQIDSVSRKFKFANNIRSVKVTDFGDGSSYQVAPFLDYQKLNNGGSCIPYASYNSSNVAGPFGGFNIVLFDSIFGQPVQNGYGINPQAGDYTCGGVQLPTFQYFTKGRLTSTTWPYNIPAMSQAATDSIQRTYLDNFLNNFIPNGTYALLYSINQWSPQTLGTSLHNTLHNLFHTTIADTMTGSRTYVLFGKKGAHGYQTHEVHSNTNGGLIDTTFYFSGNWYLGSLTSTQIGPVASWTSIHWSYNPQEINSADSTSIQLIGVDTTGNETVLYENHANQMFDYNIGFVSATQYPYLKMRMTTKDTLVRTPAQLNYWRINYQPLPEIALDKNSFFAFHADTIYQGEKITLKYALRNVSPIKMDTFYVKYSMVKSNNLKDVFYAKIHPINAWDTANLNISLPSNLYPGKNSLLIDANAFTTISTDPHKHKNELYHFNNTAKMQVVTFSDNINPLLDVTFDGMHIMNGDIVSAKPHIIIRLKDENKYLTLDSLNLFKLSMQYPGLSGYSTLSPLTVPIKFTPATNAATNNSATIEIDPVLSRDGVYNLRVQGQDRSNNASGIIDYNIGFTIINKPMISNVLNYPNPFTSQTHFVFTLTGSDIPSYFKIQIFTITGKVVKEINVTELGEGMHIGKNITQYAWDGTDEYGKRLANGLYLYRVVTNLNGSKIDHYNTSADQYFKSGFGKMYLMK